MKRPPPPALETLDEAVEVVRSVISPWAGVLWLTAIPLRLLQAHCVARLYELGARASQYGDHLRALALLLTTALLVSLWGRAVFVRAVRLRQDAPQLSARSVLAVPLPSLLSYVYAALVIELLFWLTALSLVTVPLAIILGALAAATAYLNEAPSLTRPLAEVVRHARPLGPPLALLGLCAVAALIAAANLYLVFQVGLWAAGGVPGLDVTRWNGLLALSNRRFVLLLLAGGWLAVEPFWLAAVTVHVQRVRARASGADLRQWFNRIRGAAA
jgi:hypothetical protein